MPNPIAGALIGGGATEATMIGAKYMLPADQKKWAGPIGITGGLAASGILWAVEAWRDGALASALTTLLVGGARTAEAFLLPKPAGGHDLGVLTMEELRAVVARETRNGGLSGVPAGAIGNLGPAGSGINPALSGSFGATPLLAAHVR